MSRPTFAATPRRPLFLGAALALALPALAHAESSDAALPAGKLDRATLVRVAIARSTAVRAATAHARATSAEADADGKLPPPSLMVQLWQVPLARPYAVADAQMAMIGVEQSFPAPGALGAREEARTEEARADDAVAADRARVVARDAEHAFSDYLEASARHRIHLAHREVGTRMLHVAEARQAAGGPLVEVARLEAELARVDADVATDAAREDGARARINALVARDARTPLPEPVEDDARVPAWPFDAILAKAREARPQIRAARARSAARGQELRAAEHEASWPAFTLAALYFAPVGPTPTNGYGVNASMTLPWLWGGASARREVERRKSEAAETDVSAARQDVDVEIAIAEAATRSAARRLRILRERALPASQRAFDASWAGYESARVDVMATLLASRDLVDTEEAIVVARATLDHAMADLDAAVGAPVPRVPLPAAGDEEGGAHEH